jgi:hypothetical protein
MTLDEVNEFVEAAKRFYCEAAAPDADDMEILFHALASRDHGEIEELFDHFHIKTPWSEQA